MSERGEYASIPKVLLDGPDFQRLPMTARFLFVSMCLSFNGLGIEVRYPDALVAELGAQTGATPDQVRLNLDILEHEHWIRREGNIIWLIGRLDHSGLTAANVKKHVPHVRKVVLGLPRLAIVRDFVAKYRAWFEDEEGKVIDSLSWVAASQSKGYRKRTDRLSKGIDTLSKPIDSLSVGNQYPTDSQELPKNFPNQDVFVGAPAAPTADPPNWVAKAADILASVGSFPHGRIGKALKPVVDRYGWPETEAGLRDYVAAPPNGRGRRPEFFAEESGTWVIGAREKLVTASGEPTPRAMRIMGAGR
jgi:hypothetical protein